MPYASVEDFIVRIGKKQATELTDREWRYGVDEAVLRTALEDSSSQIDGYLLQTRYRLPLPVVPRNLVRICCDLARYRLASMEDIGITEEVIERYKLSLKELELLATGKIGLDIDPALLEESNADSGNDRVQFSNSGTRVFSRDNQN